MISNRSRLHRPGWSRGAFTLVEVIVATAVFSIISVALLGFMSMSMKMVSRNLATNHSHNEARLAASRLFNDLHSAASVFTLVNYDGSSNSDISTTISNPVAVDTLSGLTLSAQRANCVRFYKLVAGPCRMTSTPTATSTILTFDVPAALDVNDRLSIPLISDSFSITAVTPAFTGTQTASKAITIDHAITYNFKDSAANVTTGYFYRPVAYSVVGNQLRYHAKFQGSDQNTFTPIRNNITSATPFSLLYLAGSALTTGRQLRVSLETNDMQFNNLKFLGAATTYQTVITLLNQDPPIKK
ncbi:MAG: hypothetical protein JWL90_1351 [Chthoniobacteraceae bacterium]|nr:hypothetical protein [Chthoniobacteraceae bacterium]